MLRYRVAVLVALVFAASASLAHAQQLPAPAPPTELRDYVKRAEPNFSWKKLATAETPQGVVHTLEVTSQKWQGIVWTHGLQVVVPKGVKPQATMVLWNQGGKPSAGSAVLALQIAERVQAPVAFLYGVPNQPLFGGKTEDALIAETFVKYLETDDGTWPLLFPMVKSVVKSMDAIQAFAKTEWQFDVTHFVVTGASKRGWTSWLTAATGDPRVKAIAPLVIDTLGFAAQMQNQLVAFGKPSEMIADYTKAGLIPIPESPAARKLWAMVDPWAYRDALTLPKMLVMHQRPVLATRRPEQLLGRPEGSEGDRLRPQRRARPARDGRRRLAATLPQAGHRHPRLLLQEPGLRQAAADADVGLRRGR